MDAWVTFTGGKLSITGGTFTNYVRLKSSEARISGGQFADIDMTENSKVSTLAGYLGEGRAFADKDSGDIVNGYVTGLKNVTVLPHAHDCRWNTETHEKSCVCGYVEATDSDAPVISGIENGKTYYGAAEFTVTDDNDFTVTVDGNPVLPENGRFTLAADNEQHTVTATDAAGNAAVITVSVMKLYSVTLPSGTGFTATGTNTAGHGTDYTFKVDIAEGYSKTGSYRVLVNGSAVDGIMGDETGDTFLLTGVSGSMTITVEGVADITPPAAEIAVGTNKFSSFMNTITFGLFFKKTQTVTVTASDVGSGLSKAEYLLSETAFEDKDAIAGDWTELTLTEGTAAFSIEPSRKAYVYLRVTDVSGNITVINSDGVVVYTDAEAITEAVSFTKLDGADVSFRVSLNGNTVAALYNGDALLDSAAYTVSADGTVTLKNSYLSGLAAGEYALRVAYNPLGEEYRSGDEPAMTSVKLTVGKKTPSIHHVPNDAKNYDGKPIDAPTFNTDSDGAWAVEYKSAGADDSAYTAAAPKKVGKYMIRITTAETDTCKAASSTMAFEIKPREVTISGVAVADKTYDGNANAKITAAGVIDGLVDGDKVSIVTGKALYDDKNVGTGKTVTFYDFALSGEDAANYVLSAQPASTTASIVEYTADGSEYGVNSRDWLSKDFVITAKQGYKLGLTDTANGEWADSLTASEETDNGKIIFFVKNTETGAISAPVTESYKIDKTAPKIVGIGSGETYYVTKRVAIDEENLASVTLNGEAVEEVFLLAGDTEATYVIRAVDKAGNVTEYTVYMKPISSVKEENSPGTGDAGALTLWIALLFVSGGAVIGAAAASKKKNRSVK